MSIKKTLGGDRLGSGKKMSVELHNYERSTHDLGYLWRSTMAPGTLVPFLTEVALPGDTFDINLDCDIKTHPTIGPLFGSYKVQLDTFVIPIRLYIAQLHNSALGVGLNMKNVVFPAYDLKAISLKDADDKDNAQINPSCILSYLGLRGIGNPDISGTGDYWSRRFNAIPFLAYWEIYKQYYANKAEEIGAVIHTPYDALVETVSIIQIGGNELSELPDTTNLIIEPGIDIAVQYVGATPKLDQIYVVTNRGLIQLNMLADVVGGIAGIMELKGKAGTTGIVAQAWRYRIQSDIVVVPPSVLTFPLENIDEMREALLAAPKGAAFRVDLFDQAPYNLMMGSGEGSTGNSSRTASLEGLAVKTYQSDLFNNWLQTEWIDGPTGINEITAIDVSGGELKIEALILQKKVYDMLNRIAVSGGSYNDWLEAVYAHDSYSRAESPMYMGGLIKELVFQEVVSNAAAEGQDLGTLAGKGILSKKHKGGHVTIKVDEPSYIMGIISLTPRVDYSQGNKWDVHLKTMDDLHKPGLDEIGFQELITEQLAWWDTWYDEVNFRWVQRSAGKQPAWVNYMTNVNQVRGNFAISSNEMFMTLNRRYEMVAGTIGDLTTYIDPAKFNFIFADTAIDAQNFWAQIAVDITARRKMSAKVMPNL